MKCPACHTPNAQSAHGNTIAGRTRVRYVVHPGFGLPLLTCGSCGLVFVSFIHPRVIGFYRATVFEKRMPALSAMQPAEILQGIDIPPGMQRVLIFAPGFGGVAESAAGLAPEVVVADIVPEPRLSNTLAAISADALGHPQLDGRFDLAIVPGGFNRLPMPRFWLTYLSKVVRPGGRIYARFNAFDLAMLEDAAYDPSDIAFFPAGAVQALFAASRNFRVGAMRTIADGSMLVDAVNEQRQTVPPPMDIDGADLMGAIADTSMSCFMNAMGLSFVGKSGVSLPGLRGGAS